MASIEPHVLARCHYCGSEVHPDNPWTWRRVTGWERKGQGESRRGGSDIVLREACDEFACDGCIGRLRRKLAPGQGALI